MDSYERCEECDRDNVGAVEQIRVTVPGDFGHNTTSVRSTIHPWHAPTCSRYTPETRVVRS